MNNNYNILIIEDNRDSRDLLVRMLGREGYQIEAVPNARRALEVLNDKSFQLILSDINLPGVTGLEFVQQLKASTMMRHIPVIAISANPISYTESYLAAGFQRFLSKPVTRRELLDVVATVLQETAV